MCRPGVLCASGRAGRERRFDHQVAALGGDDPDGSVDEGFEQRSSDYQRLVRELLAAQRALAVELRNTGAIGDDTMMAIQRDLDLEHARLEAEPG